MYSIYIVYVNCIVGQMLMWSATDNEPQCRVMPTELPNAVMRAFYHYILRMIVTKRHGSESTCEIMFVTHVCEQIV